MTNIVLLGATGHFGGRIARRIRIGEHDRLTVTSRRLTAAEQLASELRQSRPGVRVDAAAIDQDSRDFESSLTKLSPDIVVHTAGPYQGRDYRVAEACINCNSHYVDLADGRDFVADFSQLNERAIASNVLLVSGASTLPGLSSVVLAKHLGQFKRVSNVAISIAPAHQSPRGRGTISAVLSYCGKPFNVWKNNRWTQSHGWQDLTRIRYHDLGTRFAAACDVPDLTLIHDRHPDISTVTFHAALEASWEQIGLWLMAALTRAHIVRDWTRFTGSFHSLSQRVISLGSDRGGMEIRMNGENFHGESKSLNWILTAEQNHGPEIPCTPALIIAEKLSNGSLDIRGAIPCWNLFTLDDFRDAVAELDITWRTQESSP